MSQPQARVYDPPHPSCHDACKEQKWIPPPHSPHYAHVRARYMDPPKWLPTPPQQSEPKIGVFIPSSLAMEEISEGMSGGIATAPVPYCRTCGYGYSPSDSWCPICHTIILA